MKNFIRGINNYVLIMKAFYKKIIDILKEATILIFLLSLFLAISTTYCLENFQRIEIKPLEQSIQFSVSQETKFSTTPGYVLPSYFTSIGTVYVYFVSPNAIFQTFNVEMSLDNVSWKNIPLHYSSPGKKDYTQFAELGLISLEKLTSLSLYGRYYIPEQQIKLTPKGISKEEALSNVQSNLVIKKDTTPRDKTIEILVAITLFNGLFAVLRTLNDKLNAHRKATYSIIFLLFLLALSLDCYIRVAYDC